MIANTKKKLDCHGISWGKIHNLHSAKFKAGKLLKWYYEP